MKEQLEKLEKEKREIWKKICSGTGETWYRQGWDIEFENVKSRIEAVKNKGGNS